MSYLVPPIVVPALLAVLILAYAAYRPPLADDPSWLSAARLSLAAILAPAGGSAGGSATTGTQ